jgi:hypothetical protein
LLKVCYDLLLCTQDITEEADKKEVRGLFTAS